MTNDVGVRALVTEVLPWARHLPAESMFAFIVDLFDALRAVENLDSTAPIAQMIIEWQHTAEIYADPELLEVLQREHCGDFGPVPQPGAIN